MDIINIIFFTYEHTVIEEMYIFNIEISDCNLSNNK